MAVLLVKLFCVAHRAGSPPKVHSQGAAATTGAWNVSNVRYRYNPYLYASLLDGSPDSSLVGLLFFLEGGDLDQKRLPTSALGPIVTCTVSLSDNLIYGRSSLKGESF